ncbi:MAG: hypothetical protein WAO00_04335 [Chthoniobacterales bacterium]
MNEQDAEITRRLQEKFGATANQTPTGIHLQFPGVSESFELSTAHGEFTLFTATWHEHLADMNDLEGFLECMLSGRMEIVVTYRGSTPVGHQVRVQKDGVTKVMSRTGSLVPLFWRAKSYKTLKYESVSN